MKSFLAAVAVTLLASACASGPDTTAEPAKAVNCRNADAPTGSHLKRRADCEATSAATTEDARRNAQDLQELQRQTTNLQLFDRR